MKKRIVVLLALYIIMASCANPAIEVPEVPVPEPQNNAPVELVVSLIPDIEDMISDADDLISETPPIPEAVAEAVAEEYSILGIWEREFDGHTERYVFAEQLTTYADGVQNGCYDVVYESDYWVFSIGDTRLEYELVENVVLVLCGYQYIRISE